MTEREAFERAVRNLIEAVVGFKDRGEPDRLRDGLIALFAAQVTARENAERERDALRKLIDKGPGSKLPTAGGAAGEAETVHGCVEQGAIPAPASMDLPWRIGEYIESEDAWGILDSRGTMVTCAEKEIAEFIVGQANSALETYTCFGCGGPIEKSLRAERDAAVQARERAEAERDRFQTACKNWVRSEDVRLKESDALRAALARVTEERNRLRALLIRVMEKFVPHPTDIGPNFMGTRPDDSAYDLACEARAALADNPSTGEGKS